MATNGPNGNSGNIDYTASYSNNKGLAGRAEQQSAQRNFANRMYENGGIFSDAIAELKEMNKQYEDMSKIVGKMTKSEEERYKNMKLQTEAAEKSLEDAYTKRQLTDKDAIKLIKEANNLRIKGMEAYLKALISASVITKDMTDEDKEAARDRQKNAEAFILLLNETRNKTSEVNTELEQMGKKLENSGKSFARYLSESTEELSSDLNQLINTFNISKIANNTSEQNARSLLSIQNNVSKQFGFNNSQYWNFVDSLNSTLKDMNSSMGSLFNNSDLKTYMSNLSAYGITNSKMAEQQMKSSIIAEKYLGTSTETQSAIFKYMKLTNNNDALAKSNRTIVGLLKSQLGVSKEQLDVLNQQTYEDADALAALGVDSATTDKYIETSNASKAALESINTGWGTAIGNVFNEMIAMPYDEMMSKYTKIFGGDTDAIYQQLVSGNANEATKMILSNSQLQSMLSTGDTKTQSMIQSVLGIKDVDSLANMSRYFSENGIDTFLDKYDEAIESIRNTTDTDLENYLKDNTEVTFLEKIQNWLSSTFGTEMWKKYPIIANAAFAAYLGSGILKYGANIADWFKSGHQGGFIGLFNAFLGKSSSLATTTQSGASAAAKAASGTSTLSSGLIATGGGILLGAAASKILIDAIDSAAQKTYENNKSVASSQLEGTNLEGNSAAESVKALGISTADENNNFFTRWGAGISNVGAGLGAAWNNLFGDVSSMNKSEFKLFKNNINMQTGSQDAKEKAFLAWYLLADSAGRLSDISDIVGSDITSSSLKEMMKTGAYSVGSIAPYVNIINKMGKAPYKSKKERQTSVNWSNYTSSNGQGGPVGGGSPNYGMGGESDSSNNWTSIIKSPWYRVTSMWGSRPNPFGGNGNENHGGMDISAPSGTPIGSAVSGTVAVSGWVSGFGNAVYIQGDDGMKYIYGHMVKQPSVSVGDSVKAGQLIGYVGSTGRSTGPHLHFQVGSGWTKSTSVDPVPYLNTGVLYPGGAIEGVKGYTSGTTSSSTSTSNVPVVKQNRYIPTSFLGGQGGPADSTNRIVGSVDGGINRLISYLDSIRAEQDEQRAILDAFSKSRMTESNF